MIGDLRKLLEASHVGAEIDVGRVPLSPALKMHFDADETLELALMGGDDYELCFTADEDAVSGIAGITAIGKVVAGTDLVCRRDGEIVEYDDSGYRHFA